MQLHSVELTVLTACQEILKEKQKLMNQLAKTLGLGPSEIFSQWRSGKLPQHGHLLGKQWKYFFHGLECDIRQVLDGRLVRIEFGPAGRIDTFTDWGIYKFIATFRKTWFATPSVIAYFSSVKPSLPSEFSDDYQKISFIITQLTSQQLVVPVAPELAKNLNGSRVNYSDSNDILVQLPTPLLGYQHVDSRVCQRLILSAKGKEVLSQSLTNGAAMNFSVSASA